MHKPLVVLCLYALLVVFCCSGCSSSEFDLGDVRGQITLDGKPAGGVIVSFSPGNGVRSSGGQTNKEGEYRLIFNQHHAGALVGKHQVSFIAEGDMGKKLTGTREANRLILDGIEVKPGENVIDLELRDFTQAH